MDSNTSMMLELNNIEVIYDHVILVLKGVSFHVPEGSIVALLGANGAGKSTTLKAVSNLLRAERGEVTKGSIEYLGERIDRLTCNDLVKKGVIQVMEGRHCFEHLSVEENLLTGSYTSKASRSVINQQLEKAYHYFPRLKARRKTAAGYTSGGEQQMLAIGRALLTNPKLLILDEATEGLAPIIREKIWEALRNIRDSGISILIIDKNLKDLLTISDNHNIIHKGKIVWSGSSAQLRSSKEVTKTFLGI